jgi:proline-specific peptidase
MAEIDNLRAHFGLEALHLLGQSFGGQLALEYVLSGASGVVSLTVQSSLASIEEWESEAMRLVAELPEDMRDAVAAHQRGESQPGFDVAMQEFERRHIMRLSDPPDCWRVRTELVQSDTEVYEFMVGDSELGPRPESPMARWDVRPRLGEIKVPTFLISGRHDCSTPKIMQTLYDGISDSEWHILEHSSHCCQLEDTTRTLVLVADFLARADAAYAGTNV